MQLPSKRATLALAFSLSAAGFVLVPGLAATSYAAAPTTPFISEIHYDNSGTDVGEFVEVQLPPGTTSAGLSVVLYNGSNGAVYDTDPLPTVTAPADEPAVAVVDYPANGLQNGSPDGLALVDASDTVLELLSYEGVMTATDGPAAGMTSTDLGVREDGNEPAGQSLSRTYDAAADRLVWAGPATATKGLVNPAGSTPPPAPAICELRPTHEIGAVQGEGWSTPVDKQTVTVRGVVVGDLPGFDGFYLQDVDGDGNDATSDGIFVFSDSAQVDLGDTVAVTGRAGEYYNQTQVSAGSNVDVCADGTAADLPSVTALDLPADASSRERLEGMLVEPADVLTVSEIYDLTSYGELTLSEGGLLVQPTELARPGTAEAEAAADANALRRIILDDGLSSRTSATNRPYLSPAFPVRVGDELDLLEPLVLGFSYGQFRLQPADGTADGVLAPQNTRPATPDQVGGDVQVAAFNVLNYFLTWSGSDARGARNATQFERQAGKIVPAISALDADVVTLMEIEDTDSTGYRQGDADRALADLVGRLNAHEGTDTWAYVPLPEELYAVDRDVIRNGIIYRTDVVEAVGAPVGDVDETVWFNAREPIAQTFLAEDDVFTVVANHFKSKGASVPPTGDNVDDGDGQASYNGDRQRQALALAAFAEELMAETEDDDVLLMGDFNAYTQEDPIERLREAGYVDLGELFDGGRYSYVFDAMSGSLDHALATTALTDKVTDVAHWNINAVESFAYQYYGDPALYATDPFRSSDHDPLVVGLDLRAPRAEDHLCDGRVPTILGTNGTDVIQGTNGVDVISALGGADTVVGANAEDIICGGAGDDVLSGGNGDDVLYGGAGDDTLDGNRGGDQLHGGRGDDTLSQGPGEGVEEQ